MNNWIETTIGEQITLQRGVDITQKQMVEGNVPVISSGGISGYHNTAVSTGPGVIVGRKGSIGTVYYVGSDYWPHDTTLWVKDFKGNNPRFVYYFLKGLNLKRLDVGSANPTLNRNTVHPIPTIWPKGPVQDKIADILGSLDDKIELNRCMNETLEQLTMALYKHCFLDFGPFQDGEFVDSCEGIIPKGWTFKRLVEVVTINERSIGKKYPFDQIEYIDISSVGTGVLEGTTSYQLNEAPSRAKRLVRSGDVIWSTVRPNRKSYLYIHKPKENTVASTGFAVLTPKAVPSSFLYCHVTTEEFVEYLVSNAEGSAYPAVRPDVFAKAMVCVPPEELLASFDEKVGPLIHQMQENMIENKGLQEIRDYLLPRLLSGEIEMKAAEEQVQEVLACG
jgi:type I restriction enzyme S subunit